MFNDERLTTLLKASAVNDAPAGFGFQPNVMVTRNNDANAALLHMSRGSAIDVTRLARLLNVEIGRTTEGEVKSPTPTRSVALVPDVQELSAALKASVGVRLHTTDMVTLAGPLGSAVNVDVGRMQALLRDLLIADHKRRLDEGEFTTGRGPVEEAQDAIREAADGAESPTHDLAQLGVALSKAGDEFRAMAEAHGALKPAGLAATTATGILWALGAVALCLDDLNRE